MAWMGREEVMITLFELGHVVSLHRYAKTDHPHQQLPVLGKKLGSSTGLLVVQDSVIERIITPASQV